MSDQPKKPARPLKKPLQRTRRWTELGDDEDLLEQLEEASVQEIDFERLSFGSNYDEFD